MSYNTKIYFKQGGDEMVIDAGGKITAAGAQATAIADLTSSASGTEIAAAVNAIIAALEGVGIVASGS